MFLLIPIKYRLSHGIQINDVRSIYPKGNIKDVINWINRGDLLKYADKKKLESWITQQRYNPADVETQTSEVNGDSKSKTSRTTQQWPNATDLEVREQDSKSKTSRTTQQRYNPAEVEVREQDLNTAANIVKDFDNASIFDGKVTRESEKRAIVEETAARTAETLGGAKVQLEDEDTVTDEALKREIADSDGMKGGYDPKDGSVHLYIPNIESTEDAVKTIFHEKLGHEGLKALLGSDEEVMKFGQFY